MILVLSLEEIQHIVEALDAFPESEELSQLAEKVSNQALWQAEVIE